MTYLNNLKTKSNLLSIRDRHTAYRDNIIHIISKWIQRLYDFADTVITLELGHVTIKHIAYRYPVILALG